VVWPSPTARPPHAKSPGRVRSFLLPRLSTQVNCWLDTIRVRLPSATLLCTPLVIKSNFCPSTAVSHFFKARGTRLKRKSPARKSDTSKQRLGDALFLICALVAALVAVASNRGPGPSAGTGRTNFSGFPLAAEVEVASALLGFTGVAVPVALTVVAEVVAGVVFTDAAGAEAFAGELATGGGAADEPPMIQVCSGVKKGGEHGVLLTKPSVLNVKH